MPRALGQGEGELRRPGSDSRRVLVLCHAQPPHWC